VVIICARSLVRFYSTVLSIHNTAVLKALNIYTKPTLKMTYCRGKGDLFLPPLEVLQKIKLPFLRNRLRTLGEAILISFATSLCHICLSTVLKFKRTWTQWQCQCQTKHATYYVIIMKSICSTPLDVLHSCNLVLFKKWMTDRLI
jgi:hypothetical protein